MYDKTPLEQHYSPSVSGLVARLLTTDPEKRPSAREILESLTIQNDSVSVTPEHNVLPNLDTQQAVVSVSLDKPAQEEAPEVPAENNDSSNKDRIGKKVERSVRHWAKKHKLKR